MPSLCHLESSHGHRPTASLLTPSSACPAQQFVKQNDQSHSDVGRDHASGGGEAVARVDGEPLHRVLYSASRASRASIARPTGAQSDLRWRPIRGARTASVHGPKRSVPAATLHSRPTPCTRIPAAPPSSVVHRDRQCRPVVVERRSCAPALARILDGAGDSRLCACAESLLFAMRAGPTPIGPWTRARESGRSCAASTGRATGQLPTSLADHPWRALPPAQALLQARGKEPRRWPRAGTRARPCLGRWLTPTRSFMRVPDKCPSTGRHFLSLRRSDRRLPDALCSVGCHRAQRIPSLTSSTVNRQRRVPWWRTATSGQESLSNAIAQEETLRRPLRACRESRERRPPALWS